MNSLEVIRQVLHLESQALGAIAERVDESYSRALELIRSARGKVVVTGIGKSGLIARKIAATLSSTGTVAIHLHPVDAVHGDLGAVTGEDVVIILGKSGESEEITTILPILRSIGAKIVAITGKKDSTLGRSADVVLDAAVPREACPFDLAPTASTTAALAIGDALAVALMKLKNFQPQDFALVHPGGRLGKRLLLKVEDLMIPLARCPVLHPKKASFEELIGSLGAFGLVMFSSDGEHLDGILTDGDVRRALQRHKEKIFSLHIPDLLNTQALTIQKSMMAVEALAFLEQRERPLNVAPVLDGTKLVGALRVHELVKVQ